MCRVINVLSHKGGCGKSETVLNLAYGLSSKGKKVLVIDCDPQSNVTSILLSEAPLQESESTLFLQNYEEQLNSSPASNGFLSAINALKDYVEMHRTTFDIHHVLEGQCSARDAIYGTRYTNLDILPSGTELSLTDYQLKNRSLEPYRALRSAIQQISGDYDVILIDNQPFKNALTFNTIASCTNPNDLIVIPMKINRGGLEGTYETIATTMEWLNSERLPLDIKILATMTNRNKIDRTWIDALQTAFGEQMFRSTIRYQAKPVEEASMKKKILLETIQKGVAEDYWNLVEEVDGIC